MSDVNCEVCCGSGWVCAACGDPDTRCMCGEVDDDACPACNTDEDDDCHDNDLLCCPAAY